MLEHLLDLGPRHLSAAVRLPFAEAAALLRQRISRSTRRRFPPVLLGAADRAGSSRVGRAGYPNRSRSVGLDPPIGLFYFIVVLCPFAVAMMTTGWGQNGLAGTLQLPELAAQLPAAPDTYQGAPTPIAGYLAVGPKAAGLAVLSHTLVVAFPSGLNAWPELIVAFAALTMTISNLFALRQTSAKRLLAYSSIGPAGDLLVGVTAAGRDTLAVPGMLVYLTVCLFMNLGAFLAVDAIERQIGTDDIGRFNGLGRQLP